jgi:hypothetical protein
MHPLAAPAEKIAALAARFTTAGFAHAFGGAVALSAHGGAAALPAHTGAVAVATRTGTVAFSAHTRPCPLPGIDLHVFSAPRDADAVLARLAVLGLDMDRAELRQRVAIRGRVELDWGPTPLRVNFGVDGLHALARPRVRRVPFETRWIYVLSAEDLVLASALASPGGGRAELEALVAALGGDLALDYVRRSLVQLGAHGPISALERVISARALGNAAPLVS